MWDTSEPRATAELNSACWMHQVSMKSKLYRRQGHATSAEDHTCNMNVKVTVTTNFKMNQQHKKCKNTSTQIFFNNKTSNHLFPVGTLSFQVKQPIRSGKDILVSIDAIKHFWAN